MSGESAKRSTTATTTRRGGTTRRRAKSNRVSPSGSPPISTRRTTIRPSAASSRSNRSVHARRTPTWRSSPQRSAIRPPPTCCNEHCRAAAHSAGSATRCTTSRTSSRLVDIAAPGQRRGRSSGSPPSATSTKPTPTPSWRRERSQTDAALAAAARPRGLLVDVDTITARWRDIEQTLDAGHDVTLLRDGRPWATIAPA